MEDELIRGDSAVIEFSLTDDDGKDILLSDIDTLILTARCYADGKILFSKTKKDFKNEGNNYSVEILPEDTQELSLKEFVYDIEITLTDGTRGTLLGKIELKKDVTTHKAGDTNEN